MFLLFVFYISWKLVSFIIIVDQFEFTIRLIFSCQNWNVNKEVSDKFKLKVDTWKKQCSNLNSKIYDSFKMNCFEKICLSSIFLKKIGLMLEYYNLLISDICIFIKQNKFLDTRLSQNNLPHVLERLQCVREI